MEIVIWAILIVATSIAEVLFQIAFGVSLLLLVRAEMRTRSKLRTIACVLVALPSLFVVLAGSLLLHDLVSVLPLAIGGDLTPVVGALALAHDVMHLWTYLPLAVAAVAMVSLWMLRPRVAANDDTRSKASANGSKVAGRSRQGSISKKLFEATFEGSQKARAKK